MVSCLTDRGAHVNAVNADGATPLHDAVRRGQLDVIEELLQSGGNPLARATEGKFAQRSPTDLAADHPEVLALLTRYRVTAESSRGQGDGAPGGAERKVSQSERHSSAPMSPTSTHSGPPERERAARLDSVGSLTSLLSDLTAAGAAAESPPAPISPADTDRETELCGSGLLRPVRPLVTDQRLHLLWPQPQRLEQLDGPPFCPSETITVALARSCGAELHRILDTWDVYRSEFSSLGYTVRMAGVQSRCPGGQLASDVLCTVSDRLVAAPEGYSLTVRHKQVRVCCGDVSGLRGAISSLLQLLRLYAGDGCPQLLISDRPRLAHRALLVDLSPHGRVPKLDSLCHLVDTLASLKMNQLHLFQRFGAAGTQLPYSATELVSLDRYCSDRGVSVVPALEVPAGTPTEALHAARADMDAFIGCFSNVRHVHLGPHLSGLLAAPGGEQLLSLLPLPAGAAPLLCANSVRVATEADCLPGDVVLVEYGFQADYDFSAPCQAAAAAGLPLLSAAGTAAWGSLAGCPEAAVLNAANAARAAAELMGAGLVMADWRAEGELGQSVFSLPGLVAAAGLAWNPDTPVEFVLGALADLLNWHVLRDPEGVLGRAVVELGRAETFCLRAARGQHEGGVCSLPPPDGSTLQRLLVDPDTVSLEHITLEAINKTLKRVRHTLNSVPSARPGHPEGDKLVREVHLTAELMATAARIGRALISLGTNPHSNLGYSVINLGVANLAPTFCTDTANKLLSLVEQYRQLWLERHQPAGLQRSLLVLTGLLQKLIPETARADSLQ
ncbi:uncharacterized protein LOC122381028 isoform X4 [Amphibalanus amphitrite]|nr:uncharacterized protein LOC122381028 isoform X2 [Amphibalanus amphitrite]XP_043220673.1 uncharacterized protein LOC122381028 isoform X3 [Amphibalanus amphitrite]XP_043220682.1 uncharacterized protein LOC122381028 isoform X4 [Amphibalanus amphitrite]